jgi:Helix-turn-helix domain
MSVHVLSWVLRNSEAQLADRLVLIVLADHAAEDGSQAYASVQTIASEARIDRRTAQRSLRRLEAERAIRAAGKGRSDTTDYCVLMRAAKRRGGGKTPRAAHDRGGGGTAPPKPSLNQRHTSSPLSSGEDCRTRDQREDVATVFTAWLAATERNPQRTKLSSDRRRRIQLALASHGLDECLAAVTNIGKDSWARGENDRQRRFDDVEHALGSAERIERWRDWQPPRPHVNGNGRPRTDAEDRDQQIRQQLEREREMRDVQA